MADRSRGGDHYCACDCSAAPISSVDMNNSILLPNQSAGDLNKLFCSSLPRSADGELTIPPSPWLWRTGLLQSVSQWAAAVEFELGEHEEHSAIFAGE